MAAMKRSIRPHLDAAAWVGSGRWGPRRVRVSECHRVLAAELVYTGLLQAHADSLSPGVCGTVEWPVGAAVHTVRWELRRNAVWRHGRVFLTCPRCEARVTRVYVPTASTAPACRTCWGLSYESQTRHYGGADMLGGLAGFPYSLAHHETFLERERRRLASRERYALRRTLRGSEAGSSR